MDIKRMSKYVITTVFLLTASISASAQQPALFGRLTVNQTHIVFSYAGDLWSVERTGGEARRLTTHPGEESWPVFSPDGSQLAFSRQIGGNWDIYVMPASGGDAKQVTDHPRNDYAYSWSPDGKTILFMSNETGVPRLYTTSINGVLRTQLPFLPESNYGSFSSDGKRVAYAPTTAIGDWRFYRGGSKGRIWLGNAATGDIEKLPEGDYNDDLPAWVGNKIYFASDRTGIYNLYSFDLQTKQTKQLSNFEHYGVRWLGAGAGAVVFVRDGRLYLHDTATGETRIVDVRMNPDTAELKPRTVNARPIEWGFPSASGDKVTFGARGEVLVLDPATGEARNLTNSSGVAERFPAFSPDGKSIAYFSDESVEYQLHIRSIAGDGAVKKISIEPKPSFYRELTWSPDSKKIAFTDKRLALWYTDVERDSVTRIDTSVYSYQEEWRPAWSPDSRWLTYSKHLHNRVRTVFIYDLEGKRLHQVTDGHTHSELPCFDANGKYLYFASSANAGTSEFGWGVLNSVFARPLVTRRLHAIVLANDGAPPLLPNGTYNPEAKARDSVAEVRIDFDDILRRVVDLATPPRDYAALTPGKPGVLFAQIDEWPASPAPPNGPSSVLYKIDLTAGARLEKMIDSLGGGFEVTRDGSRLLYVKTGSWFLVSADAAPKPDDGKLDLKKLEVTVDPRAEWKQMYREAWRIMRDWFYEPNHHGQDLADLEKHFSEFLPTVTRRADMNALMNRMLGHISVSHLGVGGGDAPPPAGPPVRIGLLGADYEMANGRWRFKRIYCSTSYNSPLGSSPAPLDRPGVSVREGEYLLAVEDKEIEASKSVYGYFDGKANQAVKITVGPNPSRDGSRTLTVFPIGNESGLRLANWAEANRRRVEEASGGKLGYIYVNDYGMGIFDFIRGLSGYGDRAGVIIDQRYNGGGITPDYLIEWLQRKPLYYYTFREGDDIATPVNPGPAAKVLITNEQNFSAAETFAFMFKLAKIGPIVGARTGGGGIGPYVYTPRFIDGGNTQLPNRAAYNPDGTSWGIENVGVIPDYEVAFMPKDALSGRDPQLEKAIQVGLEEIKRNVAAAPKKPKYPIHR